jgi:hypothetical protein
MTYEDIKLRNERLIPVTMALARHDQWLLREEYEECCSLAGIDPRADDEIRRDECKFGAYPYRCSEDPTGALEIRRSIDLARLSAMSLAD